MNARLLTAGLGAALFISLGGTADAAPSTKSLLDGLRKAMLTRSIGSLASIHTAGSIVVVGVRGNAQEWDDVRGVRFTSDQNAGALSGANGWDGKVAWNQDYAGLVTIDGGISGRLQAINQAYLDNLRYLRPDAGGATVVYAGRRTEADQEYDVLAVTPPQGSEVDLWIDPRTHLIAAQTMAFGIVSVKTTLSNYRRADGILYPFDSNTQTSGGNSFSERISSVEINGDVAERMRVPGQSFHDAAVAGGSTTVPLQIVNNHVYASVMLDGRGPYTFVLDSGGDYIVTPEVAAALSAKTSGAMQLGGVGNATEGASFTRIESIKVGNATVRRPYMLVLPIATGFGMAEGMRIDGMIGYQFLARFLTTIDYADSKLTLATPSATPAAAPGAAAIPFFFDNTIPRVSIGIDNVTTDGEVDTGSRGGISLSTPFVQAHPAIAALAKTAPGVEGFGVGGPSYARFGRIPNLQIGPYTITNSIASFGIQSKGAMADPFNPANVGGAILRRFDVTFDYAHHQLLLAKNATFDSPATFDRSGLFIIDASGAYTVISVFPGSPGASAGLAKGDVILKVNGAAASSDSLAALRSILSGPAGTNVQLHVRNAAGERDATIKLSDYV
ncbi:MAG: aspartyl protease family protein [Candidatus Cybelea sp.]